MIAGVFGIVCLSAAAPGSSQTPPVRSRTYANPIDIDYRYNFEQKNQGISYRSGADPVIVVQRGAYYLFETIGDGYWESHDLGTWRHITPSRWPLTDVVAPNPRTFWVAAHNRPGERGDHLAARARRRRLQRALGHLTGEGAPDLPAVCRPGDDARAAGAHGGAGVLGGDREL